MKTFDWRKQGSGTCGTYDQVLDGILRIFFRCSFCIFEDIKVIQAALLCGSGSSGSQPDVFLAGILEITEARPPRVSPFSRRKVLQPTSAAVPGSFQPGSTTADNYNITVFY